MQQSDKGRALSYFPQGKLSLPPKTLVVFQSFNYSTGKKGITFSLKIMFGDLKIDAMHYLVVSSSPPHMHMPAGVSTRALFRDLQEHVHRKVMEIDFFAPWILTHGLIEGELLLFIIIAKTSFNYVCVVCPLQK